MVENTGDVSVVFLAMLVLGAAWLIIGVLILVRRARIAQWIQRRYVRVHGSPEQAPAEIAVVGTSVVSIVAGAATLLLAFLVLP